MHTWDGIYQFVPNSELWNRRLVNYSRLAARAIDLKFPVAYSDDIGIARATLLALAAADQRVMKEPAPEVFVSALRDSAVELTLRAWAAVSPAMCRETWARRSAICPARVSSSASCVCGGVALRRSDRRPAK